MTVFTIIYGLLAFFSFIRSEFVPPDVQNKYQVWNLLPRWSISVWVAVGLALALLFALEGVYRLMEDYDRLRRDSQRLAKVLQTRQAPRLDAETKVRLQHELEGIDQNLRRPVVIVYLDTPTAFANPYADDLAEVFNTAGWEAGVRGEDTGDYGEGVMLRIQGRKQMKLVQDAVRQAFENSGIRLGSSHMGADMSDALRLYVGEMI